MKVRTIKTVKTKDGPKPPGTIIDHPDARLLIELGVAEAFEESPALLAEPELGEEDEAE